MRILSFLLLAVIAISVPQISKAATLDATADINIIEPVAVTESTSMNFGAIILPAAPITAILNTADTISGAGVQSIGSAAKSGVYSISGDGAQSVTVNVGNIINSDTELTLHSISALYNGAGYTLGDTVPLTGGVGTLTLGASMDITDAVFSGNYPNASQFTITVDYQ